EFLLREEGGEEPSAHDYLQRFPDCASRLRQQLDLHRALDTEDAQSNPTQSTQDLDRPGAPLRRAIEVASPPGYTTLSALGRGGMGVVYRAWQRNLGRMVALKVIKFDASGSVLERFRAEATAVARLQHPNIVHLYDAVFSGGLPYLAMECLRG